MEQENVQHQQEDIQYQQEHKMSIGVVDDEATLAQVTGSISSSIMLPLTGVFMGSGASHISRKNKYQDDHI